MDKYIKPMRNIVICSDGTWNRPEVTSSDIASNVLKISRMIESNADVATQQVFYDWGLGSYHDSIRAGTTGSGLDKNVCDAYRYLVHNYVDDAHIYMFGFSRGAYTVRALCGLINNVGILKSEHGNLIPAAWKIYKSNLDADHPKGERALTFKQKYCQSTMRIRFVGVWDTVGALGIPFSLLGWLSDKDEFYDTKLSSNIEIARHALAIDERREDFAPCLWQSHPGVDLKQCWFPGVHSDIGGGYKPDEFGLEISDQALNWMVKEARIAGLQVRSLASVVLDAKVKTNLKGNAEPKVLPKIHKSRRHVFRFKRPLARPLFLGENGIKLHPSVKERYENDAEYRPPQLTNALKHKSWSELPFRRLEGFI